MIRISYTIAGGDYDQAGLASSSLKAQLKKIGVEPEAIRRAMIAAYEAEMNVVIHAHEGELRFALDTGKLDVEVADRGPGIPDIERAMQEGFSTAPPAARDLGFGAGMGLPNIRKNSDRFAIESTVGEGTKVTFTILLRPEEVVGSVGHSIHIVAEQCRECLRCLFACPTGALRVRNGGPSILEHLCIDCGECIGACSAGALTVEFRAEIPKPLAQVTLLLPPAFFTQFGAGIGRERVMRALRDLGFTDVVVLDGWESALRDAVVSAAREQAAARPVISPACPAVVNLIEMRFPALIGHVAPFLSPVEAAWQELKGRNAIFMAACPCERTALLSRGARVIGPQSLRRAALPLVIAQKKNEGVGGRENEREGERENGRVAHSPTRPLSPSPLLHVAGIRHVTRVLEMMENGLLGDVRAIEPLACEQGCFGSPLWHEEPSIARYRWRGENGDRPNVRSVPIFPPKAVRRKTPLAARAGLRLDADMGKAILKLSKMDELTRSLPGKNCGICGAPSCAAFAEDIVLGRAHMELCSHRMQGKSHSDSKESSK